MDPLTYAFLHWRAMSAAINAMPTVPGLLRQLVFKTRNPQASAVIEVDELTGGKYKLPFVAPGSPGVVVAKSGRQTKTVTAPVIRAKQPFTARELLLERGVGQVAFAAGAGDIEQAREARVARELAYLRDRAERTIEWMCAQALTGVLTATAGDDDNQVSFTVDYGVPDTHTPSALAGDYVWGGSKADVVGNIQTWADLILNDSKYAPDLLILGTEVAAKFLADANVQKLLDNRRTEAGALAPAVGNARLGNFLGLEVYRYPFEVEAKSGSKTKLVGAKKAIMVSTQARNTIEFGLIEDLDAGTGVVGEYFSKSWTEKDPSRLWLLGETHPLPVLWEPASVVCAQPLAS